MRDLNHQLKILCSHSHEGSISTRVGRERILSTMAGQLHDLGFKHGAQVPSGEACPGSGQPVAESEPQPVNDRPYGAIRGSAYWRHPMIALMAPPQDRPNGATCR